MSSLMRLRLWIWARGTGSLTSRGPDYGHEMEKGYIGASHLPLVARLYD